jgi:integrase
MMMSTTRRPTGHLQVKTDKKTRTRSFWAYWRDQDDKKGGGRLGLAHVRDSGRRTPRGAIVWRAGHGPKPSPEYLTPNEAEEQLEAILAELCPSVDGQEGIVATLRDTTEGWMAERASEKGLKRSTLAGYELMFERLYRDLGEDTPIEDFADGRLRAYFADFKSYKVIGESAAKKAEGAGREVCRLTIARWTAQPPGSAAIEVKTKAEALRLADEMPGTWKHRVRRGHGHSGCPYRVVPLNAKRARRVSATRAAALEAEGWIVGRRTTRPWFLVAPAAAQTRNSYRDVLAASFDYAVRQRQLKFNPLAEVKRTNKRHERDRVLRRDDFYDPHEVDQLLQHAPGPFEEAFWLCGAHAGLRLPGEALGLHWGAVDFNVLVVRPYDNWVLNALDTTKTGESEAIPMTPRLARALMGLKQRGYATADDDFVFVSRESFEKPTAQRPLREAFKVASKAAGLKPIKMYNLRHSFGTGLAAKGVDIRTIQGLMRHKRLNTTEQYMAYSPRPELASQIARALDPDSLNENVVPMRAFSGEQDATLLARLEDEIPAKWLREVQRLFAETQLGVRAGVGGAS